MKTHGSVPTITEVSGSTTSASLMSANERRVAGYILNASGETLHIAFGTAAASSSNRTETLADGEIFEVPVWYKGAITGILAANTGNIYVTEVQ